MEYPQDFTKIHPPLVLLKHEELSKSYKALSSELCRLKERESTLKESAKFEWFDEGLAKGLLILFGLSLAFTQANILSGFFITLSVYVVYLAYSKITSLRAKRELPSILKRIQECNEQRAKPEAGLVKIEYPVTAALEKEIETFFHQKLFRKRSSTPGFEKRLTDFETLLIRAGDVNSLTVTSKIDCQYYMAYLLSRKSDFEYSEIINRSESPVLVKQEKSANPGIRKQVNVMSENPTQFYAIPRKVNDWSLIQQKRMETGLSGEELVVTIERAYLESVSRSDLAQRVQHSSKEIGDGLGYDVRSYDAEGQEKYIEVKTTTVSISSSFYMSRNELVFLEQNPENYFLYMVYLPEEGSPVLEVLNGGQALERLEATPVSYQVSIKR